MDVTIVLGRLEGSPMGESDNCLRFEVAAERLSGATGQDLGDELRRQAESLAYKAAKDYGRALRRIETELLAATDRDNRVSDVARSMALDIVRTHMIRGLMRAQLEAGDHMTFWVSR